MARTKGAKGKKTLAKEAGMTLEQYERAIRNGLNPSKFTGPVSGQINIEELKKEKGEESELIKSEPIQESLTESELTESELTESESIESEPPEKPPTELKETENEKENTFKISSTKRRSSFLVSCDRCHSEIKDSAKKINLTYLTGQAPWWRNLNKDIINLCPDCTRNLSKLVEEFLWADGEGVGLKFGKNQFECRK